MGRWFEGRFMFHAPWGSGHAIRCLISLEPSRYLHLNPLRTRPSLVVRPEGWRWSSDARYHRARQAVAWIDYAPACAAPAGRSVLAEFGSDTGKARLAYRRFVQAGMDSPPAAPWSNAVHGLIVGSDTFVERMRPLVADASSDPDLPQAGAAHDGPRWSTSYRPRPRCSRSPRIAGDEAVASMIRRGASQHSWVVHFGHRATDIVAAPGYTGPSSVAQAVKRVEAADSRLRDLICAVEHCAGPELVWA